MNKVWLIQLGLTSFDALVLDAGRQIGFQACSTLYYCRAFVCDGSF